MLLIKYWHTLRASHSQRARVSELKSILASCLYESCGQQARPRLALALFETAPVFHCFFANVNACSPLTGIIQVFGHVGRDLLPPREKSRMRTTYKKTVWDSGFFAHALFLPKKQKVMFFFSSVNGTAKNPGFCQCKWPKDKSQTGVGQINMFSLFLSQVKSFWLTLSVSDSRNI